MLLHHLADTFEEDRHRGEERRHAHHRALLETQVERPAMRTRLLATTMRIVGRNRLRATRVAYLTGGSVGQRSS
jgi:hypothetical protein